MCQLWPVLRVPFWVLRVCGIIWYYTFLCINYYLKCYPSIPCWNVHWSVQAGVELWMLLMWEFWGKHWKFQLPFPQLSPRSLKFGRKTERLISGRASQTHLVSSLFAPRKPCSLLILIDSQWRATFFWSEQTVLPSVQCWHTGVLKTARFNGLATDCSSISSMLAPWGPPNCKI